jgi:gas vesicle protein
MKKKTTNENAETKTRKRTKKVGVGKVITGVAVGSVVGATVGLLLAPASGEETISNIKSRAKGIQKKAVKAVGNVEDKARGLNKKAHTLAKDVSTDVSEVKEDVGERVGEYFPETSTTSRKRNSSS